VNHGQIDVARLRQSLAGRPLPRDATRDEEPLSGTPP
jgi:hypothetical protein